MDHQNQERVQKTLDFIQKDRVIPEDPWFYSHLTARMEKEAGLLHKPGWAGAVAIRLRPILVVMVVLVGIAGGIVLGRVLSAPGGSPEPTASLFSPEEDINAAIFKEISGSMDEQIVLMK
ncbi:MAG: hypothetical protein ISS17_03510 [Bacteroidales bacterium]|nr:hypothetical protein [Bacteroidales bacterium]